MRSGRAKELARRSGSDQIEVSLRWRRADGRLTVVVTNRGTGDAFSLPARPDNALDVFYHPYVYAAGLAAGGARQASAESDPRGRRARAAGSQHRQVRR